MARSTTNEWEFQGEVNSWLNAEIASRQGMGLEGSSIEPPIGTGRGDLVIWTRRGASQALLSMELKTPTTSLADSELLADACRKAQTRGTPYFAIWNMQAAELYKTPPAPQLATPADRLKTWEPDTRIKRVEDWLPTRARGPLRRRAIEILDAAWEAATRNRASPQPIDATLFVRVLAESLSQLRASLTPALKDRTARNQDARRKLQALAAAQGFLGFVEDLEAAVAGQYAYRLVGQILFYHALRRRQPALKPLLLDKTEDLPTALRRYWNEVRRFDYEALFEPSPLETLVPFPNEAQALVRSLVERLAAYDWSALADDVLGSVFEALIPREEQILLGQFYTPRTVADLLVAFSLDGDQPSVLDPGCGSGTFLLGAYDCLRTRQGTDHETLLSQLWGFDISAFAAELAVINLFRQDLSVFNNFPRVVSGDFFERRVGEKRSFPPARRSGQGEAVVPIPQFNAVVGNPPYLRSQSQDDLDPDYRKGLFKAARRNGVEPSAKTDLFAFFVYQAIDFLAPGGTLGFVTSSSWLTAEFGHPLQRLLTTRFQLVALITSEAESFFSQVEVNTVLIVARLRRQGEKATPDHLRFVTMKRRLTDVFPRDDRYWDRLIAFTDAIAIAVESEETDDYRLTVRPPLPAGTVFDDSDDRDNWSLYLRAPSSYFRLFPEKP